MLKWVVSIRFVASGDVDSFDAVGVRNALGELFPNSFDVSVAVSAGSVNVVARILTDTATGANSTATTLQSLSNAQLSETLGSTVERVTSIAVRQEVIAAQSPPLPLSPPPSTPEGEGNTVIMVVSVVLVVIVLLLAGGIVLVRYFQHVRAQRLSRIRARTAPVRIVRGGHRMVNVEMYGHGARPALNPRVSRV